MRKAGIAKSTVPRSPKLPRGKPGKKPPARALNQATADEFDEEGMGVAPKE
jgi:hypothetical protein